MATPYVGEIRLVGFTFAPIGWRFCDGSVLPITGNETLFGLIGTTYGGDGQNTFALPDLRGRIPVSRGQAPGLTNYVEGQTGGLESVTLTVATMPPHSHPIKTASGIGNAASPIGAYPASSSLALGFTYAQSPNAVMGGSPVGNAGQGQPHSNMQPYASLSYIIAIEGIFPSQN